MATYNTTKKETIPFTMQQGDTFNVIYQYKEDDVVTDLPEGYDILVGLYDKKGTMLAHGSYSGGEIQKSGTKYKMYVDHDTSMLLKGDVYMEITLKSSDDSFVDHTTEVVVIKFEERNNNDLI